jgi:lysophospholipase L1-like esterase
MHSFLKLIPRPFLWLILLLVSLPSLAELPNPLRFESAIEAFEQQDLIDPQPEGAIVLTGSSSIARWNAQSHAALAPLTVIPRGFGGSVMNDALYYIDRVAIKYKPRAIVIYEGDNDTGQGEPIENDLIIEQLQTLITRVHQTLPETRIYVLAVKPSVLRQRVWPVAQEVNIAYQAIAANDSLVHYIDVATPFLKPDGTVMTDIFIGDNLHFNEKGNEIWGRTIKAALMPIEAQYED